MSSFTPLPRRLQDRYRVRMKSISTGTSESSQATSTVIGSALGTSGAPMTVALHHASATSSSGVWADPLPDLPPAAVWMIAGSLGFMFVAAVCLLLINLYPRHSRERLAKVKHGYTAVTQEDVELESCCTSRSPATLQARPQCARNAAQGSPDEDDREPILRKRKPVNLSIDTTVQYKGLGIVVPGRKIARDLVPRPPRSSSHEDTASSRSCSTTSDATSGSLVAPPEAWDALPSPALAPRNDMRTHCRPGKVERGSHSQRSTQLELVESFRPRLEQTPRRQTSADRVDTVSEDRAVIERATSPVGHPSSQRQDLKTHRPHLSDLEAGDNTHWSTQPVPGKTPPGTPSNTPQGSPGLSRTSSRFNVLLQKGEDFVDYTTRKLARMVYDQVNKDGAEEGLLLPIRNCEREGGGSCEVCCKS